MGHAPKSRAYLVVLCFKTRCPKPNAAARLNLNSVPPPKKKDFWFGYATGLTFASFSGRLWPKSRQFVRRREVRDEGPGLQVARRLRPKRQALRPYDDRHPEHDALADRTELGEREAPQRRGRRREDHRHKQFKVREIEFWTIRRHHRSKAAQRSLLAALLFFFLGHRLNFFFIDRKNSCQCGHTQNVRKYWPVRKYRADDRNVSARKKNSWCLFASSPPPTRGLVRSRHSTNAASGGRSLSCAPMCCGQGERS